MAVRQIMEMGEPVLREKAHKVTKITKSIHTLLDDMAETMYDANGVGLAAPQIGLSKKIVVIDVGDGIIELINPEIVKLEGVEHDTEGCLSLPGYLGEVTRAAKVYVKALDRNGKVKNYEGQGLLARAFQHELDHLEGILFVDKAENVRKEE